LVDYRNNVIYDWGSNNIYAGEGGRYNLVNNYFKYGPSTSKTVRYRIVNPGKWEKPPIPFGKFFVSGNYVDGAEEVTKNNWLGVHLSNGTEDDKRNAIVDKPFDVEQFKTETALEAYASVLENVGSSFKRDTLDQRIINDVKNRTGRLIDVQGGYPHGSAYELTLKAWPVLKSLPTPGDSDADGMPDDWEKKNGLNPNDGKDASSYRLSKQYTNIEMYINGLIPPTPKGE
jgi:hypothetical protein